MDNAYETLDFGHDDGEAPRLITTREMANRLGVTSSTIRKWAREGRIPCLRIGQKTLRFDAAAVLDALNRAHRSGPKGGES